MSDRFPSGNQLSRPSILRSVCGGEPAPLSDLDSLANQQKSFWQVGCSNTPTSSIGSCKLKVPLCTQILLYPRHTTSEEQLNNNLRGILKHRSQLYREDQEMRDHPFNRAPHSLTTPLQGQNPGPLPTCLNCSSLPAGKPPAGRLFQGPHTIDTHLQGTSPTLYPYPLITPSSSEEL